MLAVALIALGAAAPASALDLRLAGVDDEATVDGEERDEIVATGDGARLVLHDRLGCHLVGAHCEELHGGRIVTGHCEDAYGRGTLRVGRRTRRFFIAGQRCPHAGADVERGVLVTRSGFLAYVMRTRWRGATSHRERVTIRLRSLRAMPRSELTCSGCRFLVQYLHGALPPHPTRDQVVRAVEGACRYFPEQYQGLCALVIEKHGAQIVVAVMDSLEATEVCQRVRACPTRRAARGRGIVCAT